MRVKMEIEFDSMTEMQKWVALANPIQTATLPQVLQYATKKEQEEGASVLEPPHANGERLPLPEPNPLADAMAQSLNAAQAAAYQADIDAFNAQKGEQAQAQPVELAPLPVTPATAEAVRAQVEANAQQAVPPAPVAPTAPVTPAAPTPVAPTTTEPVNVQPTPVSGASYTMDQLALAGTQLVDAGKQAELPPLLKKYNVSALPELDPSMYAAFAADLRAMGARI